MTSTLFKSLFSILTLVSITLQAQPSKEHYTVVLSMDAFRWDYPSIYHTPALDSIAQKGVSSRFIPCFPSITFPNHYSMATGLHPNKHGIVHNTFYDRRLNKSFRISNRNAVQDGSFYGGEPIWLTAHRQGLIAASFGWVGSEAPIQGYQPTPWKKFDGTPSFEARADSVIKWLASPKESRPNLIMWYFEEPDAVGHNHTPFSNTTRLMVQRIDSIIGQFMAKARTLPHFDQIDFIFLGDHGMSTYTPKQTINLADYCPTSYFKYIIGGTITHLYLNDIADTQTVLKALRQAPHCTVYERMKLPKRFHYGSNDRIGDIVILADSASLLTFTNNQGVKKIGAAHGYDNQQADMAALFRAVGPSFREGTTVPPLLNLNLYNIICHTLQLTPASNDGNPKTIKAMFK